MSFKKKSINQYFIKNVHLKVCVTYTMSWGGPIELFLVPASAPRLVYQMLWYVLSCLWEGTYKRTIAVNRKEQPMWRQRVSCLTILSGPLPYVRHRH